MTTLRACVALMLASTVAGCQSGSAQFQTVRMPDGDYDRTFEIARQVIGEQFTIEKADKTTGLIVTMPQAGRGELTGALQMPGGPVQGLRRTVTANVKAAGETTLVSVKVQMEAAQSAQAVPRPSYSENETTAGGGNGEYYAGSERKGAVTWSSAGSDEGMEKKLLDEIERRLKAAGTEAEPTPEKSE